MRVAKEPAAPTGGTGTVKGTGLTLTPLRRGAVYTRRAEGGFVHDRAPADGFAWDTLEACGFISLKDVQTATVDLKLAQERRP